MSEQNEEGTGAPSGGVTGSTSEERNLVLVAHLGGIPLGFLAPLIVLLVKKDESKFIEYHAKEALNFHITLFIAWSIAGLLTFVLIGCFIMPVLMIAQVALPIMAAVKSNAGEMYRYPLTLRLIK